jgi:two-component system NarL family sensor kinase
MRVVVPRRIIGKVSESLQRPLLAALLLSAGLAEVLVAVIGGIASDRSWTFLLDHFVITNALIGGAMVIAGWPIGWQRPRNPIGWLLLVGGLCYAGSGAAAALLAWGSHPGDSRPFWRLIGTWANISWPWAITLFIPLTLLLFPTGRFLSWHWRWVLLPAFIGSALFAASGVFPADNLAAEFGVRSYLTWPGFERPPWVDVVSSVATNLTLAAAAVALIARYVRGTETIRRQLLWLLLAVGIVLIGFAVPDWLGVTTTASLFAIVLIPLSVTVAVLRYQLLDIRFVVSRFALYLVLSALVIGGYLGTVALLNRAVGSPGPAGGSAIVVLALALAFNPVRLWLLRQVDRMLYGFRRDPVRALAEVGQRLSGAAPALQGALEALCATLRLPAAVLRIDGAAAAEVGVLPTSPIVFPLRSGDDSVGQLEIGLRRGERRLAPADRRILALIGDLLVVAIRATTLAGELQDSRLAVVRAREEERRRLRHDLHDGLGPTLTGVILKAGVARRLAATEPERSSDLLKELEHDTATAIADIRRLVYELRPPALDELGLVGALKEYARSLGPVEEAGLELTVQVGELDEELPAAVEVAAYRIATESLTNVVRHADADRATLVLGVEDGEFRMCIDDNGTASRPWAAGVGLTSMRERTVLLGGRFDAGPAEAGGRVAVAIPLAGS